MRSVVLSNPQLMGALAAPVVAALASCASTATSTDEMEVDVLVPETTEQKVSRMFGTYDPEMRSVEEGRRAGFARGTAIGTSGTNSEFGLRSERKGKDTKHPYFQFREKGVFGGKTLPINEARESTTTSHFSERKSGFMQRLFGRKEADEREAAFSKIANPAFSGSRDPGDHSHPYQDREYWTKVIENLKEGESLSVEDVQALFYP